MTIRFKTSDDDGDDGWWVRLEDIAEWYQRRGKPGDPEVVEKLLELQRRFDGGEFITIAV